MSTNRKSLLPFLALVVLLAVGALNRQVLFPSASSQPPRSAEAGESAWLASTRQPAQVIDAFLACYGEAAWLRMNIRQCMHDPACRFLTEGRLVLGPGHCARLDMTMEAGQGAVRLQVVSDGETLARAMSVAGAAAEVKSLLLPGAAQSAERDRVLCDHGCGGPAALVRRLRPHWRDLRLEQSADGARLRLGAIVPAEASGLPVPAGTALRCRMEFDARTHCLERLEWRRGSRLILEVQFRDTVVNQPLDDNACMREFSLVTPG